MRDELQQVGTVDGAVAEAGPLPVPVRVQAAAADLHRRAFQAFRSQGSGPDLPGHSGGVVECVVEAVRKDMQTSVGSTGIRGTERVEFLDGAIGIYHDERARHQPKPLYLPRLA